MRSTYLIMKGCLQQSLVACLRGRGLVGMVVLPTQIMDLEFYYLKFRD